MKKNPEDFLDPIAIERRIRERDKFVENLFRSGLERGRLARLWRRASRPRALKEVDSTVG